MSETRTYQGATYQRNAPGQPWVLVPNIGAPATFPGSLVPSNPARVAEKRAEEARAEAQLQLSKNADARAQAKFEQEDTIAPTPGDMTKTGDEYLATLNPGLAGQVKALAEGRRAYPTGTALKDPAIRELIAAATQYDPALDAANASTRVATRKDFTSGVTAKNITAINTALGHLGSLKQAADELHNRSIPLWNTLANAAESASGDPRVNNFNLKRQAVVDELERVFRGAGGGTEAGIQSWKEAINSSQSPDQLNKAIQSGIELLDSRLQSLGDQYQRGMGQSKDPLTLLSPHAQVVFQHLGPGGDGTLPPVGGAAPPPTLGGGSGGGASPLTSGGGGPGMAAATGATKSVFDPETAAGLNALVQKGRPYNEAAAYVQSKGFPPPPPSEYAKALEWQKNNRNTPYNAANPQRTEATTGLEQAASSPIGSYFGGAADALTAGYSDELAGGAASLTGADYTQARDAFNAQKNIQAAENPTASLAGNVTGGIMSAIAPEAILSRAAPGALAIGAAKLGKLATPLTDAAYGAAYGSGSNNDNRLLGAVEGAAFAPVAGKIARSTTRGIANIIAPPEGAFGPAYAQGAFPTIGQRLGQVNGGKGLAGWVGRGVNTAEQAMQSMPGLGAMVAGSRDVGRDAAQIGAFNEGLQHLSPFDKILGETLSALPQGTQPGTAPHSFTKGAFDKAYDVARSGMRFVPDAQHTTDLGQFQQALDSGFLNGEQAKQVQKVISNTVGSRLQRAGGELDGDAYKRTASELSRIADGWNANPSTQPMGQALDSYRTIFDDAARRNSDPAAVALLDAADTGYAKYARVRNAAARVGGDAGTFTMKSLDRAVQQEGGGIKSGPYLRGEALMQDYAKAIQPFGDTLSNSGTGERLLTNKLFLGEQAGMGAAGLGLGGLGAVAAHPGALAPFALYAPGINKAVTRAIAPRQYILPPNLAAPANALAAQINNRAPLAGRLAVPTALQWWEGQ